jgi:hypothetical protein
MKLRNFLIACGLLIAFLPHVGFSIAVENILFSVIGFVLILSSFYIEALEDRHGKRRIIKDDGLVKNTQKNITKKLFFLSKTNPSKKTDKSFKEEGNFYEQKDFPEDTSPKIKKAVSDVKINTSEIDTRDEF